MTEMKRGRIKVIGRGKVKFIRVVTEIDNHQAIDPFTIQEIRDFVDKELIK